METSDNPEIVSSPPESAWFDAVEPAIDPPDESPAAGVTGNLFSDSEDDAFADGSGYDVFDENSEDDSLRALTPDEPDQWSLLDSPPTAEYEDEGSARAAIQRFISKRGYGVMTQGSKRDANGLRIVRFSCDRGGKSGAPTTTESKGKRITATRRCGCPFVFKLRRIQDGSLSEYSEYSYRVEEALLPHNHEPSRSLGSHPSKRRVGMTPEMRQIIRAAFERGCRAGEVFQEVRQRYPDCLIYDRDIYNVRRDLRKKRLAGRTPTQVVMELLSEREVWTSAYETVRGEYNIYRLFFSYKGIQKLLIESPEVLIVDATYKTNVYGIPLINIVGTTPLGTSFFLGFAFVEAEDASSYVWVLAQVRALYWELELPFPKAIVTDGDQALIGAVKDVFPDTGHLTCTWHVNNAVLTKCKPAFRGRPETDWEAFFGNWKAVMWSLDRQQFNEAWQALQDRWEDQFPEEVQYLRNQWLNYRQRLILRFWTNQVRHYGTTVTSRAEGQHAVLKKALKVSTGDLLQVLERIQLKLDRDLAKYAKELSDAMMKRQMRFFDPFWSLVSGRISPKALGIAYEQSKKSGTLDPCRNVLYQTHGIPCAHRLQTMMQLTPDDFDRHWHLEKDPVAIERPLQDEHQLLLAPRMRRERGLPARRRQPQESTMRASSAFELVDLGGGLGRSTSRRRGGGGSGGGGGGEGREGGGEDRTGRAGEAGGGEEASTEGQGPMGRGRGRRGRPRGASRGRGAVRGVPTDYLSSFQL